MIKKPGDSPSIESICCKLLGRFTTHHESLVAKALKRKDTCSISGHMGLHFGGDKLQLFPLA